MRTTAVPEDYYDYILWPEHIKYCSKYVCGKCTGRVAIGDETSSNCNSRCTNKYSPLIGCGGEINQSLWFNSSTKTCDKKNGKKQGGGLGCCICKTNCTSKCGKYKYKHTCYK